MPSKAGTIQSLFQHWTVDQCVKVDLAHEDSLFCLQSWSQRALELPPSGTHFGYVSAQHVTVAADCGSFTLTAGMYFSVPGRCRIDGPGSGVVISQQAYQGLFQIGGPIESRGRLKYIDGCSDTLLISPVLRGEACLNLLHLPPRTRQTAHTHPSFRAGVIVAGAGVCRTVDAKTALRPGDVFSISAHGLHSFHTEQQSLAVIAFHPDSDFGPWHDDHPMVNRTLVDGIPASQLSPAQRRIEHEPQ